MDELFNLVRREADRVRSTHQTPRQGTITSYDEDSYSVRVKLQPEEVETGWLPIMAQHIGNDYGILTGPEVGDQVALLPSESDGETHTVVGRHFSDQDKPPKVKSGEILIKHKDGRQVFFDKDGNLTAQRADGTKLQLGSGGDALLSDKSGGVVYVDGSGKVHLGTKDASDPVMLVSGPSSKIFGVP